MSQKHTAEIEQLRKEHSQEIERIKHDEAGKAMENLASILLDLDTSNISLGGAPKPIRIEKREVEASEESMPTGQNESEATPPTVDDTLVIDPYIDTALCTSCNECINKNKAMFHYNGDKMAYIADPTAGTYQQLVEAAELCPVAIIHPGTPLNRHEPDLESLMERAAKFN
jgi:ferredoxin